MAGHGTAGVGILERVEEKGGIAHDAVERKRGRGGGHKPGKGGMCHLDAWAERRVGGIFTGLKGGIAVDVDARHVGFRKTLGHHEGNESGARADVENGTAARSPCPEQHAVGAHFHGAAVVAHAELSESESVCHVPVIAGWARQHLHACKDNGGKAGLF